MKYDENNLTDLLKNEEVIWDVDDLEWLDSQLVYKLQNNELPEHEKHTLIEMMANDQAVMNRYLLLKQQTTPLKETILERLLSVLKNPKAIPIYATSLALVVALVVLFDQTHEDAILHSEPVRGIPQVSIYPADKSTIKLAPDYFIVNNKGLWPIRLQLNNKKTIEWVSELQQSNKFYLPIQVKHQLKPGVYSWIIKDKDNNTIAKNSFTLD